MASNLEMKKVNSNKKTIIASLLFLGLVSAVLLVERANGANGKDHAGRSEQGHDAHGGEHGKHEEHGAHDEHAGEKIVKLTEGEIKEFGISVAVAGPGKIANKISLPGEVNINADRLAHIVPQVSGIVRKIYKNLGDRVKAGELMAVLESRELADAKSAYYVAKERLALAEANFTREKNLWKKRISSEQDYLEAKQALAEAKIEIIAAGQKLHALGFSETALKELTRQPHVKFTRYEIRSPFNGTITEKHITIGEKLTSNSKAFTIADLSSIWVNLSIYQKDMPFVEVGQKARISIANNLLVADGVISYVGPLVGEKTRTATARVVLPNPDGRWKPGLFVTGEVEIGDIEAPIVVPRTALQRVDEKLSVFVQTEEGFEPRPVTTGRVNETHIEITSGLSAGERYVTKGAFTLKAQLSKGAFGEGHSH